jgi:hypothetical protein
MRRLFAIGLAVLPLSAVFLACSDDDSPPAAQTDAGDGAAPDATADVTPIPDAARDVAQDVTQEAAATTGTAVVTVAYTGTEEGTLAIALFATLGQPPTVAQRIAAPTFPHSHTFPVVPPGNYFLHAYLDVGNNNFVGPGPEDPESEPTPVTITAGQTTNASITLAEPDAGM